MTPATPAQVMQEHGGDIVQRCALQTTIPEDLPRGHLNETDAKTISQGLDTWHPGLKPSPA
eukprot:CAMPEP_0203894800 /NCGR_PEP_ID=MMETSP0359-20131031/37718_1 /ASSEMBLY_ACC=CAM_ASM_000338 /TAXON_ID=268821 /ORGANISM="Scrippsiella Hangoei, Strain SHTV-5" /LENGTH=60 /DNA_ID=CAMNT_0050817177 /DNA_START=16 /DNA_END=195 /DNA_ORIENTATION=+